jgi:hypothetical protein
MLSNVSKEPKTMHQNHRDANSETDCPQIRDNLRCRLRRMIHVFIYSYRSRYSGSFAPLLPSSLEILFDSVLPSSDLALSFSSFAEFFF